jgi:tetratricopeptide (TPR) repeat protein
MAKPARAIGTFCLISLVVACVNQAALSEATNKPSNPKAQAEFLAIQETWVSGSPETYNPALTSFERLRGGYPGTLEAELAFVEILAIRWCKGEQQAVLGDYQTWLAGSPSPVAQGQALRYFAEYAAQSGEFAKAEGLYKQAIALAGNHIVAGSAASKLASLYLERMNRPSDALSLFQQTAAKFSGTPIEGNIRRRWAQAVSAHAGKPFPEPQEQVRTVLAPVAESTADPASLAYARYNLGEVLVALSRPDEALAVLERAAPYVERYKSEPWAADCLSLVIMLQHKFNRYDDAIASARRYLNLFPGLLRAQYAQFEVGELLYDQRRWDEAISEFRALITRWPNSTLVGQAQALIASCEAAKSNAPSAKE